MTVWGTTYSRLPNGFFDLAEVLDAGDKAALFLLRMSDFADRNATDGELSDRQTASLGTRKGVQSATERLSDVGLLERKEDDKGWRIVGWLDGHKTAEDRAALRKTRQNAGQKGGKAKAKQPRKPEADDKQVAKQVAKALLNPEQNRAEQNRTDNPSTSSTDPCFTSTPPQRDDEDGGKDPARVVIAALGPNLEPTNAEAGYVRKALNAGAPLEHLVDLAEVARTTADSPRRYLAKCLATTAAAPDGSFADHSVCCNNERMIYPDDGDPYQCPGI